MATQTAPAAFPYTAPDYGARSATLPQRPRPRVLWPWPVFLLGIAALLTVAFSGTSFVPPTATASSAI